VRKRIPNVSLGTIYRTLSILKEAGLIQALNYGGSFRRYDDDVEKHYHITCTKCGRVVDLDLPLRSEVEHQAAAATGFRVTDHRLEFYGICPDCSSSLRP
jgi:Fur family peroxide stress response transcriptional regulator